MGMVVHLCVCMCTMYALGAHRDQKSISESLELELQDVNCHLGAGYWTCALCKSSKCS